jgi:hypothetical protein
MWRRERAAAARLKYEEHVAALKAPPAPRPPSRYSMSFGRSIGAAPAPAEPRRKAAQPSLTSVTAYREVTRDDSPSPPPAPRSSTPRASTVAPKPPAAAAELRGRAQAVESSDSAPRSAGVAVERRKSSASGAPGFDWAAVVGIFQARGRCVLRGRLAARELLNPPPALCCRTQFWDVSKLVCAGGWWPAAAPTPAAKQAKPSRHGGHAALHMSSPLMLADEPSAAQRCAACHVASQPQRGAPAGAAAARQHARCVGAGRRCRGRQTVMRRCRRRFVVVGGVRGHDQEHRATHATHLLRGALARRASLSPLAIMTHAFACFRRDLYGQTSI